jgi:hypothetical protein
MTSIPVNIATEDELSETTLKRLIKYTDRGYAIGTAFRRGGYGHLKKNINGWNRAAATTPVIVLTDLDSTECPVQLIGSWLERPAHPNLMLHIAVREIEAWLLADRENLASYFRVREDLFPADPDSLKDPKATVVGLAKSSRLKDVKSRVVPKHGSTAKQGPDYNGCLSTFIAAKWNIDSAAARSLSLTRAIRRLSAFSPVWA